MVIKIPSFNLIPEPEKEVKPKRPKNITPIPPVEEIKKAQEAKKKAATKKKNAKKTTNKKQIEDIDFNQYTRCLRCGLVVETEKASQHFYKSTKSEAYKANSQYTHLCKECTAGLFDLFARKYKSNRIACMIICQLLDLPYYDSVFEGVNNSKVNFNMGSYFARLNGPQYKYTSFQDSIVNNELFREAAKQEEIDLAKMTENEKKAMEDCIEVIGYDPFKGYGLEDKKFLFMDLIKYLDEDSADDAYKLSQIIQIVNNNNQINKYNKLIAECDPTYQIDSIKTFSTLKNTLVSSNDRIAKENEISVKNRSNKEVGKNTLTYTMRDMREKNFKEIETNYYNQLRSESTQWGADMSLKAIKENCFFDENDREEVFEMQREMVVKTQKSLDDEMEKNRLLNIRLKDLENFIRRNAATYEKAKSAGVIT